MSQERLARLGASGGILFIVLQLVGQGLIQVGGSEPSFSASSREIVDFFEARNSVLFNIGGLVTIVVTMVALGIAQLTSGDTSNLVFLIINVAVALIVAGLIWRSGSWALVLGAIVGLFGVGLVYGPFLATATSNLNSIFDFGAGVVATVASILALVGSVVAFVQVRRGTARVEATAAERIAVWAVAGAVVVLVALSGVLTLTAVTAKEQAGATEVLMKRTEFKIVELNAEAGETLRLVLRNDDMYIHTFTTSI